MSDNRPIHFRNLRSYQSLPINFLKENLVIMAAPRGIPKKTPTLFATGAYSTWTLSVNRPMTLMKRSARGTTSSIWSREFMATRIAQYSLSPPASPVQIKTIAIPLAMPTNIKPSRNAGSSGRNAHDDPNCEKLDGCGVVKENLSLLSEDAQ